MLEKLWDDVVAGPRPETGLEKLRKAATTRPLVINKGCTATRPGAAIAELNNAIDRRLVDLSVTPCLLVLVVI
uniref:Uncharacterized protein n=1 Tax=Oryza nivara TaxID=4536 RepID=A0A0E0J5A8_ORYNI